MSGLSGNSSEMAMILFGLLHFSSSGSLSLTLIQELLPLGPHLPSLSQSATPVAPLQQSTTPVAPPLQSAPAELHQLHTHSSAAMRHFPAPLPCLQVSHLNLLPPHHYIPFSRLMTEVCSTAIWDEDVGVGGKVW